MSLDFVVEIPPIREPEHTWIVNTIFRDFLHLKVAVTVHASDQICIRDPAHTRKLTLPSILLTQTGNEWTANQLPERVEKWIALDEIPGVNLPVVGSVPLLFADAQHQLPTSHEDEVHLPWDLFGSAFYMLSRLEEYVSDAVDSHGRFLSSESLAVREGFERIPVVNVWSEILFGFILQLWPGTQRNKSEYRLVLSHDVDWPLVSHRVSLPALLKSAAGDVLVRKSMTTGIRRIASSLPVSSHGSRLNPGNTFDFIMSASEKVGVASAFYFIAENTAGLIDGTYRLSDRFIGELLLSIYDRGHEIGLHPGYGTYQSEDLIRSAYEALRTTTDSLGINQSHWGGRQHYLRWSAQETWRHWESARLDYDSTLGFTDRVGFRTGACSPFSIFDLKTRKSLKLREKPLTLMEVALFATTSPSDLNLDDSSGMRIVRELVAITKSFGGEFTLLWHNSSLITRRQRDLYLRTLTESA